MILDVSFCSAGPSEPLAAHPRPIFDKLGLGGVPTGPKKKVTPTATPAPELEEGNSAPKLTKKQRKLAAQAERLAQARSQPQAGPSKPIPTGPKAANKQSSIHIGYVPKQVRTSVV